MNVVALGERGDRFGRARAVVRAAFAGDLPPGRRVAAAAEHRGRPLDARAGHRSARPRRSRPRPRRSATGRGGRRRASDDLVTRTRPSPATAVSRRTTSRPSASSDHLERAVHGVGEVRGPGVRPVVGGRVGRQQPDQPGPPLVRVVDEVIGEVRPPSRAPPSWIEAAAAPSPTSVPSSSPSSVILRVVGLGPAPQHGRDRVPRRADVPVADARALVEVDGHHLPGRREPHLVGAVEVEVQRLGRVERPGRRDRRGPRPRSGARASRAACG